jgi:hypothetical protein
MSYYFDNKPTSSFMDPVVQQHGSHMVMQNVHKTIKERIVNIDTKYRKDYDYTQPASANVIFGERLAEVRSLEVVSADLPITFYNIHDDADCDGTGNNYLKIVIGASSEMLILTPGYYTSTSLKTEINARLTALGGNYVDISFDVSNNLSVFLSSSSTATISMNVNRAGNTVDANLRNSLGWILGFRDAIYTVTSGNDLYSEQILLIRSPRHMFIALNEFSQSNSNSFVSPLEYSNLNKNIVAKISIPPLNFGDTLCANRENGYLVSEIRKYGEKVNIQRMNLQLLDDAGRVIHLNGADFSVCLKMTHE